MPPVDEVGADTPDRWQNPGLMNRLMAIVTVGCVAAMGILLGAGHADAQIDRGTYRYCNTEYQGNRVPVPWCSTATVSGGRFSPGPGVRGYPIIPTRDGGYVELGRGDGLKMHTTAHGYAGAQYVGNRVIAKFVMTRLR